MPDTAAETVPEIDGLLCFAVYSAGHAFNRVYEPRCSTRSAVAREAGNLSSI